MPDTVDGFVVELESGVEAAGAARRAVRERAPDLADPVLEDVLLLVTELVTNAVLHGRAESNDSVRLECRRESDRLQFLVSDSGTQLLGNGGPPGRVGLGTNGDHSAGWGLFLVEEIAERWGILAAEPGTCVWFEVAA